MKFNILIFFSFLFALNASFAQNYKNRKAYKRMEGTIGKDIGVTANCIELFGNIKGNYQYKFEEITDTGVSTYYGKMIELNGELFGKDSIKLKEEDSEDYTIKGVWGVDFLKGKWKIPGEDDYMDMLLKEYYPDGSITFKVYYLKSVKKLVSGRKDSPEASIELVFVFPSGNYNSMEAEAEIKKTIITSFFGKGIKTGLPDVMLKDYETEYYENYKKNKADWLKLGGSSFSWDVINTMDVKFNSDYLLCMEYRKYAFTGGAHGIQNVSYDVFNMETGKKLRYEDIFKADADSALTVLLTKKMKEKYKTKTGAQLTKIGFFVDTIQPNHNVYITGNGVGFKYAGYEIAAYAMGLPEIFLNFDELKGLIREDCLVYKLMHK